MSADDSETLLEPIRGLLGLTPDGPAFATRSSRLQPVLTAQGEPAMLKLAVMVYEKLGGAIMTAYAGRGAAKVLQCDGDAVVLERLLRTPDLSTITMEAGDEAAVIPICEVVSRLHACPKPEELKLPTLSQWFRALREYQHLDPRLGAALSVAERLLAEPRDEVMLHADIHHENILWSPAHGWQAIDPQGVWGERTYDYVNLFTNPAPHWDFVLRMDRVRRLAGLIAAHARVPRDRVLAFAQAHAGLSAAWHIQDGDDSEYVERALWISVLAAEVRAT